MKKHPTPLKRLSAYKTWQLYIITTAGGLLTGVFISLLAVVFIGLTGGEV